MSKSTPNGAGKKGAQPVKRKTLTPQQKAAQTRARNQALEQANAQRLAQVVNLMISGHSLAEIGAQIGATAEEMDSMLTRDMSRYVRTQPALRVFVRNYISGKYTKLLDTVWDEATDKNATRMLEAQDRAVRILDRMAKLHGAEAPVQTEVKVDAAPEAVEALVQALAAAQGQGYDDSIFDRVDDIVDAEVVHEAAEESALALEAASDAVEDPVEGETL